MQPDVLDPQAVTLAKAIRQSETGGDFNSSGKSGEYGGYQFTDGTWNAAAQKYLGQHVPLKAATPQQQNEVAYKQIKEWKDKGFNVGQIASMWNAGQGEPNAYTGKFSNGTAAVGTNKFGAHFDVPSYVKSVAKAYHTLKGGSMAGQDPHNPSSTSIPGIGNLPGEDAQMPKGNIPGIGALPGEDGTTNGGGEPAPAAKVTSPSIGNQALSTAGLLGKALGMGAFGQGIATAGRVFTGHADETGNQEGDAFRSQKAIIDALQKMRDVPKTDPKKAALLNMLRKSQGQNAITQGEIDPGTKLSKKAVLKSAAITAALALAGGSTPIEGAESGVISSAEGGVGAPVLARIGQPVVKTALTGGGVAGGILRTIAVDKAVKGATGKGLLHYLLDEL